LLDYEVVGKLILKRGTHYDKLLMGTWLAVTPTGEGKPCHRRGAGTAAGLARLPNPANRQRIGRVWGLPV